MSSNRRAIDCMTNRLWLIENKADMSRRLAGCLDEASDAECRKQYYNAETGHFKGEPGERFKNCVKYNLCRGIKPTNSKYKTPEEAAQALCAFIAANKG